MRRSVAAKGPYEVEAAVDAVKAEEQLDADDADAVEGGAVTDAASLPASAARRERADIWWGKSGREE